MDSEESRLRRLEERVSYGNPQDLGEEEQSWGRCLGWTQRKSSGKTCLFLKKKRNQQTLTSLHKGNQLGEHNGVRLMTQAEQPPHVDTARLGVHIWVRARVIATWGYKENELLGSWHRAGGCSFDFHTPHPPHPPALPTPHPHPPLHHPRLAQE